MGYTPPSLEVRKIAGGWSLYAPSGTTTDDLVIYPNTTDSYSRITLNGNAGIDIATASGSSINLVNATVPYLRTHYVGTEPTIISLIDGKDLNLLTTGTGVLRFGTHTASGDVAVNGSVAIKTADGVARKLATIA